MALHFLELLDGEFFPELIRDSTSVEVLTSLNELIHEKKVIPFSISKTKREDAKELFLKGKLLLYRGWASHLLSGQMGSDSEIKWTFPLSWFGDRERSFIQGYYLAITRESTIKEGAKLFIRYLVSPRAQEFTFLKAKKFPARKDLYSGEEEDIEVNSLRNLFAASHAAPPFPYYPRELGILGEELRSAVTQEKEPGEALENAWRRIISLGKEKG